MNEIYKTHMTALAGYGKKILQTATNLQPRYILKKILRLENIKKNDTFSDGNFR